MSDQLTPTASTLVSPTGLKVRADLYDEDYSDAEYEQMIDDVRGHHGLDRRGRDRQVQGPPRSPTTPSSSTSASSPRARSRSTSSRTSPTSRPGDEVEVFLEHLEDQEGAVVLSKKKADFMRVWEKIRVAHESDQPVEGTLVKKIKGGVVVDLMGVDAFLPGSPDRAPPGAEHRRAARPDLRVQDHQAQQAPPQHRRLAPRDPRERAGPQARAPDEGAGGRPGAEGRGQEHHRLRRVHRPRRRGRPAAHHRHVVRPRLAPERDGRRSARSSRSRSSTSTGSASASASA